MEEPTLLYQYQTFAAGCLALLAAIVSGYILLRGQRRADERQREALKHDREMRKVERDRQRLARLNVLLATIENVRSRSKLHTITIDILCAEGKPVVNETREHLRLHVIDDPEFWDAIELVDPTLGNILTSISAQAVTHNFYVSSIPNYEEDELLTEVIERLKLIENNASKLSHALVQYLRTRASMSETGHSPS